ncbi:MAG: hypothetical protein WEA61_09080 [Anaerolineales bacterium]
MTSSRKGNSSLAARVRRIYKRTWGTVLIYIGVAAWLPYFYLLSSGRDVSILPFLAVHLIGVLSGAWLRSRSGGDRVEKGRDRWLRWASRALIYLGVLAWAPYFYLTRVAGVEAEIAPYLTAHLTGVLSGVGIRLYLEFR